MISKNLELIRRMWGLKQNEMAALFTNVTTQMYQSYENGTRGASIEFYIDLSDYTGISIKRLQRDILVAKEIPDKPLRGSTDMGTGLSINFVNEPQAVYMKLNEIQANLDEIRKSVSATR